MVEQVIPLSDLALGLNTKHRVLAPGFAQRAENIRYYPRSVRRALGCKRIINTLEREPAVLLNGKNHFFVSRGADSVSGLLLTSAAYTVEFFFKTVALFERQTLVFKGVGEALDATETVTGTDYNCILYNNGGVWTIRWTLSDGSVLKQISKTTDSDGDLIVPNQSYVVALADDGTNWKLYLFKQGASSAGSAATLSSAGFVQQNTAGSHFYVGAQPTTDGTLVVDRAQYFTAGIIQEVRFWSDERTTGELVGSDETQVSGMEAGLAVAFRLTGDGPYEWTDLVANAQPLAIEPRDASWTTGLFGSGALSFDGFNDGLRIPRSYIYRNQEVNDEGEFEVHNTWAWYAAFQAGVVKDHSVIFHWTHMVEELAYTNNALALPVAANDLNGLVTATNSSKAQAVLDIVKNPASSNRHFRFAVWLHNETDSTHEIWAVCDTSVNVVAGTAYDLAVAYDAVNQTITLFVDKVSTSQSTATAGKTKRMYRSDNNNPTYSSSQYAMELMRAIKKSRKGRTSPGDSEDVDVQYDFALCTDGILDQVCFAISPNSSKFLANYLADNEIVRRNVDSLGSELVQCLPMEETTGDELEDIGTHANHLNFMADSGHGRGRSLIPTRNSSRITGLFDRRFRSSVGEQRQSIAVQGGSVFTVLGGLDHNVTALSHLADGMRNDDDNNVTAMSHLDGLILATGSGMYHLWKDQLWNLAIDPPEGFLGVGLVDQVQDSAALKPGLYRYAFTYLNERTGKRSPVGQLIQVEWFRKSANVGFGSGIEINQTYPRTGYSEQSSPWDMKNSKQKAWVKIRAWYGRSTTLVAGDPDEWQTGPGTSGPNTNKAPYAKVRFNLENSNKEMPYVEDLEDVQAEEFQHAVERKTRAKSWVRISGDDKVEVISAFLGANAFMKVGTNAGQDLPGTGGIIGWPDVPAGGEHEYQGTGATNGPALPFSPDPQVTHLEIWRTFANGSDFFRVVKLPNGTVSYVDTLPDSLLGSGPPLDVNNGAPPPCKYVVEFDGRALYFGNKYHPQRIWFSERGEPWNVAGQNIVDLVTGDSYEIRLAAQTQGILIVANQDTFFVFTPSDNPDFPFDIQRRSRDTGADSFFSAVNVHEAVYWLAEKGIYGFTGDVPQYQSELIEPTLLAIANRDIVVGAHYRREESVIWVAPLGGQYLLENPICDGAILWNYRIGGQGAEKHGWSTLTGLYSSFLCVLPDASEVNTIYIVDPLGYVMEFGAGEAYGPDVSVVTTETTAAQNSTDGSHVYIAQLNDASYPDGYKGLPVTVVDSDGTRETRYITADNLGVPSKCTVNADFSFTPALGDEVLLGSIEADWLSGDLLLAQGSHLVQVNRVHVQSKAVSGSNDYQVGLSGLHGQEVDDVEQLELWEQSTESAWSTSLHSRGRAHRLRLLSRGSSRDFEVNQIFVEVEPAERGAIINPT